MNVQDHCEVAASRGEEGSSPVLGLGGNPSSVPGFSGDPSDGTVVPVSSLDRDKLVLNPGVLDDDCPSCASLQHQLSCLQREQEQNQVKYTVLKQKIISTDVLLKKYGQKCQECDGQNKKLEEVTEKLDIGNRSCETLESRLIVSQQELKPLKKANLKLQTQHEHQLKEIQTYKDKCDTIDATNKQFNAIAVEREKQEQKINELQKMNADLKTSKMKVKNMLDNVKAELQQKKAELGSRKRMMSHQKTSKRNLQDRVKAFEIVLKTHGKMA